jgi:hypothetical protein
VDVPDLSRLRAGPDYDALTDGEHAAVLDASELLDGLRLAGYGFALARDGTLIVAPPAGARPEEGARPRVAALAPALGYVLRLERWADPLPAVCRRCAAPVERFSPGGYAYCGGCYALAEEKARRRAAGAARAAAHFRSGVRAA